MTGDWSFVVWIVVMAIPVGLFLATRWSRSRGPSDAMNKDEPDKMP
ncbi:hypothetical protein FG93_03336 [Bosea sp. LC85]|nr:hypothetical protein FG93_03336 [Bosea sp. LC85]